MNSENPKSQDDKGIRTHNKLSNYILNAFFGSKKVVSLNTESGEIHLNRKSLDKWLESHNVDPNNFKNDQDYVQAIKDVCGTAVTSVTEEKPAEPTKKLELAAAELELSQLTPEKAALLEGTRKKVDNFKEQKLQNYQQIQFPTTDGTKTETETAALIGVAMSEHREGYIPDSRAQGYAGVGHPVSQIQVGQQKIFGGAGIKIHISIDPTIPGNRLKAIKALEPILTDPKTGVVQYKVFAGSSKEDLEKWFGHSTERPGGQQGKEITLYLVDEQQIKKAKDARISEEKIEMARKFVKTPEQIAKLIQDCYSALNKAEVQGIGYLQNVSDKYLNEDKSVGMRDDRNVDGNIDNYAHVGEHAYGNYDESGKRKWGDPSDEVIELLKK